MEIFLTHITGYDRPNLYLKIYIPKMKCWIRHWKSVLYPEMYHCRAVNIETYTVLLGRGRETLSHTKFHYAILVADRSAIRFEQVRAIWTCRDSSNLHPRRRWRLWIHRITVRPLNTHTHTHTHIKARISSRRQTPRDATASNLPRLYLVPPLHRRQRRRGYRGRIHGNIWSAGDEMSYIPSKVCQNCYQIACRTV